MYCCPGNATLTFTKQNNRRGVERPNEHPRISFTTGAKATGLNKHGGALQITRQLLVGTTVLVRNKRGTQISAKIVSQINAEQGVLKYGIEFVEEDTRAATFWRITFPPN